MLETNAAQTLLQLGELLGKGIESALGVGHAQLNICPKLLMPPRLLASLEEKTGTWDCGWTL